MSKNESQGLSVLKSLQATEMLSDWAIIGSIRNIPASMFYREKPFAVVFDEIQDMVAAVGHVQLRPNVDSLNSSFYLSEISQSYERVLDQINMAQVKATAFLGCLKTVYARTQSFKAPFGVLYSVGASEIINAHAKLTTATVLAKLKDTDLKALAQMELGGLLEDVDLTLAAMIEGIELTLDNLKSSKRLAAEKYAMAKDQVNAALSGLDTIQAGNGLGGDVSTHRRDVDTLKGLFGNRVQIVETSALTEEALELDEELPVGRETLPALSVIPAPEEAALVVETSNPEPVIEKPKAASKGRTVARPVSEPVNVQSFPFNNVGDQKMRSGMTLVDLQAQEDPSENGVWVYNGVNAPLTRKDAALTEMQEILEDTKLMERLEVSKAQADEGKTVSLEEASERLNTTPTPEVKPTRVAEVIASDAFISLEQKSDVLAKVQPTEEDDFPTQTAPQEDAEPAMQDEDDFPTPTAVVEDDEDFPVNAGAPVDRTPASAELAALAEQDDHEAHTPTPVVVPVSEKPAVVIPPGVTGRSLFKPRNHAAPQQGSVAQESPEKVVPPPPTAPQSDDIDEFM